jgi:hypothetical protein
MAAQLAGLPRSWPVPCTLHRCAGLSPASTLVHVGCLAVFGQTANVIKESVGGSMSITRTTRIGLWAGGVVLSTSVAFAQNPSPSAQTPSSQTPPSTAPTTTATDQATSTYGSPVTITGCVQQATGSSAGSGSGGFVLRNASGRGATSNSGASSSAPSSTSPSAASSSSSTMGQEFQLMPGSSSVQLADHVGHQVEVTGTFGSPLASSTTPSTTTGTTGSPSGTDTSSSAPGRPSSTQPGQATSPSASNIGTSTSFTVTSVRMLSATCPQ